MRLIGTLRRVIAALPTFHRILLGGTLLLCLSAGCIEAGTRPAAETDTTDTPGVDSVESECNNGESRCVMDATTLLKCVDGNWDSTRCSDVENTLCFEDEAGPAICLRLTGNDTCREVLNCVIVCDGDDCGQNCVLAGEVSAGQAAVEVLQCINDNGCLAPENGDDLGAIVSCVGTQCAEDLANCYYPESGLSTCGEALQCASECDQREACFNGCVFGASFEAQRKYAALEFCLVIACATKPGETCVEEAFAGICQGALTRCAGDN
ncbi:MAG: hypothetical protein ACI9MR_001469 [Myxococcota bacterium]